MASDPISNTRAPKGPFDGFGSGTGPGWLSPSSLFSSREEDFSAMAVPGKKKKAAAGAVADMRTAVALKSHSEAERRRRERINAHLAKLRSMIPSSEKMDKAALLAEVINHMKELKSNAVEIRKNCTVPSHFDDITVEFEAENMNNGSFFIKASLSCDDCPELFIDVRQALHNLQLKITHAEIITLGGRVQFSFKMLSEGIFNDLDRHIYTTSIHQALKSVIDKVNSPIDFVLRKSVLNK